MNTADLFNLSNAAVLPFWALMILLPNWNWTRQIMSSMLYFVPLILLYVYFISGSLNADSAAALANPKLADIARFFGEETAAATGWTHFLVMDLFVGRWVYWEGQRTGVWSRHSILLCLFAGPLGLLSHIVTAAIDRQWFAEARQKTNATATSEVA